MIANPAYYPHDYADEVSPNDLESVSLEGWATWLAKGGDQPGPRDDPEDFGGWQVETPADGEELRATETAWLNDVVVRRSGNRITFEPWLPVDFDFAAIRFGPHMGWSPDDILDPTEDLAAQLLEGPYGEPLIDDGDCEYLALGKSREVVLVYRADPPRLELSGAVQ